MVLSGTKKTSSISSIVNQNQGGGMKKAGKAPTEAVLNTLLECVLLVKNSIIK